MQDRHRFFCLSTGMAVALLAGTLLGTTARAEEGATAPDEPNTGALTLTFDNSFTTAYMFRGILNERDGLIWQPSIDLSLNVFESEDGVVRSVDLGFGTWASVHSEDTGSAGGGPDAMYEADYYPSVSVSWVGGVTSAVAYYFFTSPNNAFLTVEELTVDLSYDDSELLGAFAMSPTATFAFETHRSSLGTGRGVSLELGVEPGAEVKLPTPSGDKYPISVTFPVKLGLSLDDYYKDGSENDAFGYARMGLHASVPLACIPARYGLWSVTNGFDVYFLNDALEAINRYDEVYPVWTSSLTLDY